MFLNINYNESVNDDNKHEQLKVKSSFGFVCLILVLNLVLSTRMFLYVECHIYEWHSTYASLHLAYYKCHHKTPVLLNGRRCVLITLKQHR